jgi:hypothetical protein
VRSVPTILAILPLVAGPGCTAGSEAGTVVQVEATALTREAARSESVAMVRSGRNGIQVRRTIRLPDDCRQLSGDLVNTGGTLTLRIRATPDGRRCRRSESYLAYTARIEGLPTGRYYLRVIHAALGDAGSGPGPEERVLVMEEAVYVP